MTGPLFTKQMDFLLQDLTRPHKAVGFRFILSNRSEIWQAPRQHYYQDACEILEPYNHYNI